MNYLSGPLDWEKGQWSEKNLKTASVRQDLKKSVGETLNSLPERVKEISPTCISYLERKEVTGIITEVALYQGARISKVSTEDAQVLVTEKLNGCTAIAIWTQDSLQLSHFPPFMLNKHLETISTLLTPQDLKSNEIYAIVYLSAKRSENESKITEYLAKKLGEDVQISVIYYDSKLDKDSEFMALEHDSSGTTLVHYGEAIWYMK